jgi:hypothetical protein
MTEKKRQHLQAKRHSRKGSLCSPSKFLSWKDVLASKWFLPLVCVLVLVILLSLWLISDIDIGFHLRGGQWMLENSTFHKNDVFTYTVNQNEYIAMHWLFQVLLYAVFTFSSYGGLTILKTLLIVSVFLLIFIRMKTFGVPMWLSTITLFATVFVMILRFTLRPEIFSWILLLFTLIIMDQYFYYNKNYLFWLLVVQLFWVNLHPLFIFGWVIIGAYLLSISFHRRNLNLPLLKWFILSVAVSVLNPYFFRGIGFPFYLFTRLQSSNIFKSTIAELQSPWVAGATVNMASPQGLSLYLYYVITFVSFALVLITYKKRKIHEYLLLGAFFYLSFMAIRNIPFFIFIAVQLITVSLRDINIGFKGVLEKIKQKKFVPRALPLVFSIFIIHFYPRIITDAFYVSWRYALKFGVGLDNYSHPVGAADFIVTNNLGGRIINDLNTGSWFIWKLPQPVFIDGRLEVMKESFYQKYLESMYPGGLQKLIVKYKPEMIIFDYAALYPWNNQLVTMTDWRVIYWDETAIIYAHRDYASQFSAIKFIDRVSELGIDTTINNDEVWNILKTHRKSNLLYWLDGFYQKQEYPVELVKMGICAFRNNEFRPGELLLLEFLKRTRGSVYEVYLDLGLFYYHATNDYKKALFCFERVLNEHPDNTVAKQAMDEIKRMLSF